MALSAAVSRRPARVIRSLISTSWAKPAGGDGSRNCEGEVSAEVFHCPACGSIRGAPGREQKRQGKAPRSPLRSCAWIGVRLSEINIVTTKILGQLLR